MAGRLRRLEGMVRGMMDAEGDMDGPVNTTTTTIARATDGSGQPSIQNAGRPLEYEQQPQQQDSPSDENAPQIAGHVVRGRDATTSYVGATHCMAMLEDVSEMGTMIGTTRPDFSCR